MHYIRVRGVHACADLFLYSGAVGAGTVAFSISFYVRKVRILRGTYVVTSEQWAKCLYVFFFFLLQIGSIGEGDGRECRGRVAD